MSTLNFTLSLFPQGTVNLNGGRSSSQCVPSLTQPDADKRQDELGWYISDDMYG